MGVTEANEKALSRSWDLLPRWIEARSALCPRNTAALRPKKESVSDAPYGDRFDSGCDQLGRYCLRRSNRCAKCSTSLHRSHVGKTVERDSYCRAVPLIDRSDCASARIERNHRL